MWPLDWFLGDEVKIGREGSIFELGVEDGFSNELEMSRDDSKKEELNFGMPQLKQCHEALPRD